MSVVDGVELNSTLELFPLVIVTHNRRSTRGQARPTLLIRLICRLLFDLLPLALVVIERLVDTYIHSRSTNLDFVTGAATIKWCLA